MTTKSEGKEKKALADCHLSTIPAMKIRDR